MIFLLITSHLVWGCALVGFWSTGRLFATASFVLSGLYLALQLYAAAQLLLPALLIHPEDRNRGSQPGVLSVLGDSAAFVCLVASST